MSYRNFVVVQLDGPLLAGAASALLKPAEPPYQLPPEDGGVLILADSMGKPSAVEVIKYASRVGLTLLGIERGQEDTADVTWPGNSYCYQSLTAGGFEAVKEIIDVHVQESDPHPQYLKADSAVSLAGPSEIYVTQTVEFAISDFDAFRGYSVQVTAGTASITGGLLSFKAPSSEGSVTLAIFAGEHRRDIVLDILPDRPAAPVITLPASTGVLGNPTLATEAFSLIGPNSDTHASTDWEIWTGPGRTGTLVWSSLNNSADKLSITLPQDTLAAATDYHLAVRHIGTTFGASEWAESSFTTAATFNSYIPAPTATPAAFGDPLDGGFYAGMIWGQIAQSPSSKALATGSQDFIVPDMTGAPIVYEGQLLEVRSRANPANKFIGTVTGAIGTTLTLNVTSIGGSGTFNDWSVMARHRVIVAPKASGENVGIALKTSNSASPTACQTLTEGWTATEAMRGADTSTVYPAAHWARNLNISGRTDWYIPARDELELCWRNLKPVTNGNDIAARPSGQSFSYKRDGSYGDSAATHGTNNNSSPTGATYTTSSPAQTAATAFRSGGAEAFEFSSAYYWSCSEYSATNTWYQLWHSSNPGGQSFGSKSNAYRVRAVRRSII